MGALSAKLRDVEDGGISFWCPGCDEAHVVLTGVGDGPRWEYNGDVNAPTFSPSIAVSYNGSDAGQIDDRGNRAPPAMCHSYVTAGNIQFLDDCTHALAGQTLPIPDWPLDADR